MHIRFRPIKFLYYLLVFVILVFFGKVMFWERKNCMHETTSSPNSHSKSDRWNLNDHDVELQVKDFIRTLQRKSLVDPPPDEIPKDCTTLPKPKMKKEWGHHQLGLIVPYRDRFEELKEFVPYMSKYLNAKKINHKIFVMNQVDTHRFNRASLINVGFLLARNESCDYIAMHDVDLLPVHKGLNYGYPKDAPFHVAAPHLHPKYHYKTFVGGILLLSVEQYETLNGLSNKFWGWGREDDEFYMRIIDQGYQVHRHGDEISTGYNTFRHIHGKERKRDYAQLPGQKKSMFSRDHDTGVGDVRYVIKKRQDLHIDGTHCYVIDVSLECDVMLTPWCDMPKIKLKH